MNGMAPACPIRVVSMVDATERRSAFADRASATPVAWSFFDAKTALIDGLRHDTAAVERNKGRQLTRGEIGCYASHFAIWSEMIEHGTPQCIVLEDDTIVDWAFVARLAATNLEAEEIRYLRLYAKAPTFSRVVRRNFLHHSRAIVELVGHPYGTQGYMLTLAGARALMQACATITRPIDDQMDRSWEHGVRNLALYPAPIIEEFVESGIGSARFAGTKSAAYRAPQQRFARWINRQRIRAMKLGLIRGR